MEKYKINNDIFGLSTAQNEIFEVSCSVILLDKLREDIEQQNKNKIKDEDWGYTENDFPLKIVSIHIDENGVYFEESTIFN